MSELTSWPGSPLDATRRYRAVQAGLIYELVPAKGRPNYWRAAVKRGNRHLKSLWQPLREDALLELFTIGFFPVGLQLKAVNARNTTRS